MKKSGSYLVRAAFAIAGGPSLCLSAHAYTPGTDLPMVHEGFDKNETGAVLPSLTTSTVVRGYGLIGNYTSLGNYTSGAIQVVDGGLAFGGLSDGTGKCLQISMTSGATGIGMTVDGGKAVGDTDFNFYDKLYCSYLVKYSAVSGASGSGTNWPRTELRVANNSFNGTGVSSFQLNSDGFFPTGTVAGQIQPAVAYWVPSSNQTYIPPVPAPQSLDSPLTKTFMMIGRFTQVGNFLGATPNGSPWALGATTITVNSATNIGIGQYVRGTGIATNTRVIGISGTTIYLSKPTTAEATVATPLSFATVAVEADISTTATWTTTSTQLTAIGSLTGLRSGMIVTGTGIQPATEILVNGSTVTLNKLPTAAGTAGTLVFRTVDPIRATFEPGDTIIEVDRNPLRGVSGGTYPTILPGTLVEGPGIQAETYVKDVSEEYFGTEITLTKPAVGFASDAETTFFTRVGRSTLFALSEAQFNHFTTSSGPGDDGIMLETDLDTAAIGTANNQVTARIEGAPQIAGSFEFMPGRQVQVIGGSANNTAQTFKIDDIRYGTVFRSVTQPAVADVPTAPNLVEDKFSTPYFSPSGSGFGWKSSYYEVENTASPQGAYIGYSFGSTPLTPGNGRYMITYLRDENGADQGIRRRPDPAVVNLEQPYTVNFDYQLVGGWEDFGAFADRIQIGADGPSGTTVNFGPNPDNSINLTWMVGMVGGDDGTTRPMPGKLKWYFFDYDPARFVVINGSNNYFMKDNMVETGIQLSGRPFRFKIEVDAPNFIYHATVSEINPTTGAVLSTFTARNLRFRVPNGKAHSLFWGASKPAGDSRFFALDNLSITPGITAVDPFPTWVSNFPSVPVGQQGRTVDADGDGRLNFLEYALDGNPGSGAASGKERTLIANISGTNYHTLTIPVRTGLTFTPIAGPPAVLRSNTVDGITYEIQGSYDLVNFTQQPVLVPSGDVPTTGLPALGTVPGWEYKTFRLPAAASTQPKGFLRALITNQ